MTGSDAVPLPNFGEQVALRDSACTPSELFRALFVDLEDHVHYLKPAFELVRAALAGAASVADASSADAFADALLTNGGVTVKCSDARPATSWAARVAREHAPLGLSDGAWLRGYAQANMVETEVGMHMLRQLMLRLGDPATSESYATRYAALLTSLGVPPESITRWEWSESAPCAEISFEHALLGLGLGLFPSTFALETLGYNLWMAGVGPCPLLEKLAPELRERGGNLRYVQRFERTTLTELARRAVRQALTESDTPERRARVTRGFDAARASYLRWQDAMLGRNVPFSPRDFVLDGIRRKARFAVEHHRDLKLKQSNIGDLLAQGGAAHELLLDKLAASSLITPGDPDKSRFLSRSLSIDGPMFDAFTASEKLDLREWIARLPEPPGPRTCPAPVPLSGHYTAPQDLAELQHYAFERFSTLDNNELYFRFANADLEPSILLFGRAYVTEMFERLSAALDGDERLASMSNPPYSERVVAEMVAEQYRKNVRSREQALPAPPEVASEPEQPRITQVFDGSWLQGFADVRRSGLEEYGWLFRIYASEHGDGNMAWNHCLIFRRAFSEAGPDVMLPKTDRRFYDLFEIGHASLATLAISMNTQRFLPEILGLNLAIEATGVGGMYLDQWKHARKNGEPWKALAHRLHNSIDNHADGHTKWSLAAVQAFMRRVQEVAPDDVEEQWRRIWRPWRCQDILTHGTESERAALAELLDVTSLAPT